MRPVAFLDRDGTLNRERGGFGDPALLEVLPGVREALHRMRDCGWRLIVVTNQSGIARGLYSEQDLARVHARLHDELGGGIEAILHCPHHPAGSHGYGGDCRCRKPAPGLLHQAQELLGVAFEGGAVIGDSARDLLIARGLPLATVLVRSGKPVDEQRALLATAGMVADHEADDLPAAVDWLLARARQPESGRRAAANE